MDQFRNQLWGLGGWFRAFTPPTADADATTPVKETVCESKLLGLPSDVLYLICDQLDVPAVHSLALACRTTNAFCAGKTSKKMLPDEKRQLLLLLERDPIGKGTYYCQPCNKLHPYEQTWGPQPRTNGGQEEEQPKGVYRCGNKDRFAPIGNPFDLSFAHARLVMNSHYYGSEYGIPIENLCIEHSEQRDATKIECNTTAKILDDELYLQRTYNFRVNENDVKEFRKSTGARDFRLCEHTAFFSTSSIYRQHIPQLSKRPSSGGDGLVPCENATGSCGLCLMDYDITIAPVEGEAFWTMTIRAYHQLGSCRSPDDWKWARFTEACRPHLFFPNRPNRRGSVHDPGSVRQRWVENEVVPVEEIFEQPINTSSYSLFRFPVPTWLWTDAKPLAMLK